jgi:hypothetical protein
MRKLRNLFAAIAVLGIVGLFSACTEETYVTITVNPATVTAAPGSVVTFVYTLSPDAINNGELGDFFVDQADGTNLYTETYSGGNSITDSVDITIPNNATVGTDLVLTFRAIDGKSGMEKSTTVTITVESGLPTLVTLTGKTLNYNNGGTSSWNSSTPFYGIGNTEISLLSPSATASDIDVALCYQATYGVVLASPDASWFETMANVNTNVGWTASGKNHTKLEKLNGVTWDQVTNEYLSTLTVTQTYVAGNSSNGVAATNLVNGDLVAFETADGIKGVFQVTANSKDAKGNLATATITCDAKYIVTAGN